MFPLKKKTEAKAVPESGDDVTSEPVQEMKEKKHVGPEAVKEESTVYHNKFGAGTVRKIEDGDIFVEFGCGLRLFPYPDAIEKGWLTL